MGKFAQFGGNLGEKFPNLGLLGDESGNSDANLKFAQFGGKFPQFRALWGDEGGN